MIPEPTPRPRLVDVAREAGVSVATASRALGKGSELIRADTRDHVRQVARRLGYRVNPVARSLRLSTTGQIGMVVPSIGNPFFMELVAQVEHCLAERGLNLLLADARMSVAHEDHLLRSLESGAVDGLVVVPCHETYSTPALERAAAHVPTVQLDRGVRLDVPMVGVDDPHGIRTLLDHLAERGVERIALLSNTGSNVSSVTRVRAARVVAEELGMRLDPDDVIECSFSVDEAGAAVNRVLDRSGAVPDAFLCLNDLLAIGAITALRGRGIAVPERVQVTGFDDIQFAALMRPTITTLHQPLDAIAHRGVSILMGDDGSTGRIHIEGTLVERESTRRRPGPSLPDGARAGGRGRASALERARGQRL